MAINDERKPMTKSEIVEEVSEMVNCEKKAVKDILEAYNQLILLELKKTGVIRIGNIGKMKVVVRKSRIANNPITGETVEIPSKKVPKFTFSKGVKDFIAEQE